MKNIIVDDFRIAIDDEIYFYILKAINKLPIRRFIVEDSNGFYVNYKISDESKYYAIANIVANYTQVLSERLQNTELETIWLSYGENLSKAAEMAIECANKHQYAIAKDIVKRIFEELPIIDEYFERGRLKR